MNKCKETARSFSKMIKTAMKNGKEPYEDSEKTWVEKNFGLVIRFFQEANDKRLAGEYASQKGIIEDLRNNTSVRDTDRAFKINNDCVALLAHVYNDCLPKKYFRTKKRNKVLK